MNKAFSKAMVLGTIILMDMLVGTEFDLFVSSFPELQHQFGLSAFWVEALLSVNFAGFCVSLFFVGGLSDRYGRRPILLLGLTTFIMGSLLCLWGTSYPYLLVGRFLQGVGVAAPATLSFLIIADTYPLKKQQFIMSMMNGVMNASVAAAPILGSYITLYFHWQGNFAALLIFGVLTLLMTALFIPAYQLPQPAENVFLRGYLPILKSKPVMLLIVYLALMCIPYWIFVGMSPILYMEDLGVSLQHFGYYQGVLALIFALGSVFFGFLVQGRNPQKMLKVANHITFFGFACIAAVTFTDSPNPLMITMAFIPFIIGQIIPSNLLFPICLNFMPRAKGRVSAVMQGSRLVLTALTLQLAGYSYRGSFQNIGIIIIPCIFIGGILLVRVIKNQALIKASDA